MAINNGIASMNPASPADLDPVSQGAAQIRTVKSNLQSQFPNIGTEEATNPTSKEFNQLVGIKTTESIQSQIDKLIAEDVIINGKYMPKAGGEFSGFVNYLSTLGDPALPDQLAPKKYVDLMLPLAGGTLVGAAQIKNPNLPLDVKDLTNKKYVDDSIAAATPIRRVKYLVLIDGANRTAWPSATPAFDPVTEEIASISIMARCFLSDLGYSAGDITDPNRFYSGSSGADTRVSIFTDAGRIGVGWRDMPRISDKLAYGVTTAPVVANVVTAGYWQYVVTLGIIKK